MQKLKLQKNNHIPETGQSYTKYRFISETCILIYKKIGFTPFQVLQEVRDFLSDEDKSKITFAGRLDPMAEGYIHILWSGDEDEKGNLMGLDKQYKVEVLIGIKTDTDDILGLIDFVNDKVMDFHKDELDKFVGPFEYNYPKYSSPHIKDVLKGNDFEYKKQNGYIYDIKFLGVEVLNNEDFKNKVFDKLGQCNMTGYFRLDNIKECWNDFFDNNKKDYQVVSLNVRCKSGTYMRVLARELGGFALGIERGEVF